MQFTLLPTIHTHFAVHTSCSINLHNLQQNYSASKFASNNLSDQFALPFGDNCDNWQLKRASLSLALANLPIVQVKSTASFADEFDLLPFTGNWISLRKFFQKPSPQSSLLIPFCRCLPCSNCTLAIFATG